MKTQGKYTGGLLCCPEPSRRTQAPIGCLSSILDVPMCVRLVKVDDSDFQEGKDRGPQPAFLDLLPHFYCQWKSTGEV